jgi:hypothetical protein
MSNRKTRRHDAHHARKAQRVKAAANLAKRSSTFHPKGWIIAAAVIALALTGINLWSEQHVVAKAPGWDLLVIEETQTYVCPAPAKPHSFSLLPI